MRAFVFAFLLVACGRDDGGGAVIGTDMAEPKSCTGCPCCCAKTRDAGHDRESDAGSLPGENLTICKLCVEFALSRGDAGDNRACNSVQ